MGSNSRPRSPETQLSGQLNKKTKKNNNKHLLSFRPAERKSDTLYFSGAVNQVQCVFHQPPVSNFRKTRAALHKRFGDGIGTPGSLGAFQARFSFMAYCFQTCQDQLSAGTTVHFEAFPHRRKCAVLGVRLTIPVRVGSAREVRHSAEEGRSNCCTDAREQTRKCTAAVLN